METRAQYPDTPTIVGESVAERHRSILRWLGERVPADVLGLILIGQPDAGEPAVASASAIAAPSARERWHQCIAPGRPWLSPFDPRYPPRGSVDRFCVTVRDGELCRRQGPGAGGALGSSARVDAPLMDAFHRPSAIGSEIRVLVSDGERLLAWLGLLRHPDRPFSGPERRRLHALAADVCDLVRLERAAVGAPDDLPGLLLLKPTGRIRRVSKDAHDWLTPSVRAQLGSLVRACDRSDASGASRRFVDGFEVSVVRLVGENGRVDYLARLAPSRGARISPLSRLSTRQREVAVSAAAGATVGEIARDLGLSPNTVARHLRAAYRRLDVSSRTALAGRTSVGTPE